MRPPTRVPLMRMNWRSRPRRSSSWSGDDAGVPALDGGLDDLAEGAGVLVEHVAGEAGQARVDLGLEGRVLGEALAEARDRPLEAHPQRRVGIGRLEGEGRLGVGPQRGRPGPQLGVLEQLLLELLAPGDQRRVLPQAVASSASRASRWSRSSWRGSSTTSRMKPRRPPWSFSNIRSSIDSGTHHGDSCPKRPRRTSRSSTRYLSRPRRAASTSSWWRPPSVDARRGTGRRSARRACRAAGRRPGPRWRPAPRRRAARRTGRRGRRRGGGRRWRASPGGPATRPGGRPATTPAPAPRRSAPTGSWPAGTGRGCARSGPCGPARWRCGGSGPRGGGGTGR